MPDQLARDLRAVAALTRDRTPARRRLEQAVGQDLADDLLRLLTDERR